MEIFVQFIMVATFVRQGIFKCYETGKDILHIYFFHLVIFDPFISLI